MRGGADDGVRFAVTLDGDSHQATVVPSKQRLLLAQRLLLLQLPPGPLCALVLLCTGSEGPHLTSSGKERDDYQESKVQGIDCGCAGMGGT